MLLGDLGADVVKVEPPGGEWGRGLGPPFVDGTGAAVSFLAINRNKRSVVVDLKHPRGLDVVLRLAEASDVFLESFRPGVAERLGIGYEAVSARRPEIVYASISAFGRHGPWRDLPGVDGVVQAMGGIMSITGGPSGPPVKIGVPAADMMGAFCCAQAILAALFVRERTGQGQRADVSLLRSLLAFQMVPISMFLATGEQPARLGSAAPYAAPNEVFPTRDGYVMVAAYTPERWQRLCETLGRPELASDPRFDTNEKRVRDRPALKAVLAPIFSERTTAEWVELLRTADILCGPLYGYGELLAEEHVKEADVLFVTEHPAAGEVAGVGGAFELSATPLRPQRPSPVFPGENSQEVLSELGFTAAEIEHLLAAGAVQNAPLAEIQTT
jgi:crotonobetainyl-CoA:carnitine CoA-transferase CaiB-like acyl-CoA transferase